jgi:hypothetical protein
MDMALDKDTLAKHQFWILLGSYLFFWLIAVVWLISTVPGEIKKATEAYDKTGKDLQSAQSKPINTEKWLPPWREAADKFSGHKSVIWKDAWDFQMGMYDWPDKWKNKDMTTPQTELTPDDRSDYRNKWYPQQIDVLRKNAPQYLYPVELKDGFDQIFQPLDGKAEGSPKWEETPTREEVWLAQEDFWVKRELLYDIYGTMANLALMQPKDIDEKEKMPEGVEDRYRYANQNWEITLNLRKNTDGQLVIGGDSTIKNLDPNHRTLPLTNAKGEGIHFSVFQDRARTEFMVEGEPVGWNETRPFSLSKDNERKDYNPLEGISWEKIKDHPIYVSQGFDRTNCPIRCLSALRLGSGAQDCRTFYWKLQPNHILAELDALPEDKDAKGNAKPSPSPGGPGGGMPPMPGGGPPGKQSGPPGMQGASPGGPPGTPPGGSGASAETENLTPNNKIDRDRYLQPADQDKKLNPPSRHLPLALRLVVMQSHMHDVLLALANSRLRIQITQVEFQHDKEFVPQEDKEKEGTEKGGFSRVFMGAMPGMYRGSAGMGPGGPRRTPGVPPPPMPVSGAMGRNSGMPMPGMRPGRSMPMPMPPMMAMPGQGKIRPSMAPGMGRGGPMQSPSSSDGKTAAQNQRDDNLVDITIYCIATLYRHPDPPKTTEQPGQPGQPTTPPGQQQPGQPAGPQTAPPAPSGQPAPSAPAGEKPTPAPTPADQKPTPPPPAGQKAPTPAPPVGKQP